MQIKDEERDEEVSQPEEDNGIPIYSSLESLLFIPKSMSKELSEKAIKTQEFLDKWSNNRRRMVRKMEDIAEKLHNWEKGCAISTTVGSSVGVVSGFAIIGGVVLMPPVAVAGLIVGTAAGISNLATGISKWMVSKSQHKELIALIEEDERLFEELLVSRQELMEAVKKIVEGEEFYKHFKDDDDMENKLKTILGFSVTGVTGLGARFAITSMVCQIKECLWYLNIIQFQGRLSSSLAKGVLHSVAAIGIILDSVTLVLSAKTLQSGAASELGTEVLAVSGKMEMIRQKVVKHFLNADVWNDEEDDQLSDVGSIEILNADSPLQRYLATTSSEQQNA
ncbi:hypothetical protein B9Z55_006383 [Caenorhabditis nigoni]|uniref:Uncharacterized protein n=1 Tax=Caenorhabditis nigoni TaxID=1611254 RepID=A0A2G5V4Z1_9PELO|nr:hypothetical protein B9Z55_006383 [Caenorhabditis nigoni]